MNGITVGMRVKLSPSVIFDWMDFDDGVPLQDMRGTVNEMNGTYARVDWDGHSFTEPIHVANLAPLFPEIPVAEVTEDLISGCGYDPEKIDFQLIAEWVRNNEDFRDLLQETISAAIEDAYPDLVAFDPNEDDEMEIDDDV